jgi:hypothetical protein
MSSEIENAAGDGGWSRESLSLTCRVRALYFQVRGLLIIMFLVVYT